MNCIHNVAYVDAKRLVERFHYSHRMTPRGHVIYTGGLEVRGRLVAVVVFGVPPTRWSEPVVELTRLVRHDMFQPPLSSLIATACRDIKREGNADLLVSFADASKGHHGGVYQACSWRYHGQRDRRMDGLLVNGHFVPGRTCNSAWGTQSATAIKQRYGDQVEIEPHYDEGKHLYWRALTKAGVGKARRLGLEDNPYPKSNQAICDHAAEMAGRMATLEELVIDDGEMAQAVLPGVEV